MTAPRADAEPEPSTSDEQPVEDGVRDTVSSIALEDGSEYLLVDPGVLIIGANVRTDADLDKGFQGFAKDIGKRGVKAPIRTYRNPAGELVVFEGQMRVRAAVAQHLERVRVLVEPEPDGDETTREITRIIDQLNDNFHRTANTEADEILATQELLALGMTARALEQRRSIPRRRAQTLMSVAGNAAAAGSVTDGIADLFQAAVFVEFDGDDEAIAALSQCLRADPDRFDHVAQRLRDDREERRLRAEVAASLDTQGVTVIDEPTTYGGPVRSLLELRATAKTQPGSRLTVKQHQKCPGHAAYLDYSSRRPADKRVEVVYVCTDYRAHGHPLRWQSSSDSPGVTGTVQRGGTMTDEQKAYRRTVIANGKAWDSATTVRRTWLASFARKALPKDAAQWRTRMEAEGSPALRTAMELDHPLAVELLGLQPKEGRTRYHRAPSHPIADAAATASRARAEMLSLVMMLAAIEDSTDRRRTWESPSREQQAYFVQLAAWGYPVEPVEQLVIDHGQPTATTPAPDGAPVQDDQPTAEQATPVPDTGADHDLAA